jgi:hypothetical protein
MGKIKYQGGITKLICQKRAERQKNEFRKELSGNSRVFLYTTDKTVDFEVVSFSGAGSFEDQLLSLYSFVYYAGIPTRWVIYSDKSYTREHIDIIKREFPFVTVLDWDYHKKYADNKIIQDYSKVSHMAMKLYVIISHPYEGQTIYTDSDIVFYKHVSHYFNSTHLSNGLWYVPDALGNVTKFFDKKIDAIYPLNAGFLILNKHFNVEDVFTYFESLNGNYGYFSEQSSFEFALQKQMANILDPRQFIIDTSDQFDFSSNYYPQDISMRHYTSPVRHKMWQNGWKWHFRVE